MPITPLTSASDHRSLADAVVSRLPSEVRLLGLGEPLHGVEEFGLLRNALFAALVEKAGFTTVTLESSAWQGRILDAYVRGGSGVSEDEVMATGINHGFGEYAYNRALVRWMREQNRDRPPASQLRFVGFDAPVEWTDVPDPRPAVQVLYDFLAARTDVSTWDDDLRAFTDDLRWTIIGELPRLRREADPDALADALLAARTAAGTFAYDRAITLPEDRRWQHAANIRGLMMADNLEALAARGRTLVFAHNQHLRTGTTELGLGPATLHWQPAGAHLADRLGPAYHVIACAVGDAPGTPPAPDDTVEGLLHRDLPPGTHLLPASALDAVRPGLTTRTSENFAYIPLDATVLDEVGHLLFLHAV